MWGFFVCFGFCFRPLSFKVKITSGPSVLGRGWGKARGWSLNSQHWGLQRGTTPLPPQASFQPLKRENRGGGSICPLHPELSVHFTQSEVPQEESSKASSSHGRHGCGGADTVTWSVSQVSDLVSRHPAFCLDTSPGWPPRLLCSAWPGLLSSSPPPPHKLASLPGFPILLTAPRLFLSGQSLRSQLPPSSLSPAASKKSPHLVHFFLRTASISPPNPSQPLSFPRLPGPPHLPTFTSLDLHGDNHLKAITVQSFCI